MDLRPKKTPCIDLVQRRKIYLPVIKGSVSCELSSQVDTPAQCDTQINCTSVSSFFRGEG